MPATYEPIATTTLGSAASSITFSSISSAYTDLRLVLTALNSTSAIPYVQFNSDTAANYSSTNIAGDGATAGSNRATGASYLHLALSGSTNTTYPTFYTMDIFSYAGSTFKTALTTSSLDFNGSGYVERIVGLWRSTSPITSITIDVSGAGTYNTGTTATLYGIKNA